MTKREWHGCTDDRGHSFNEGTCEDCGMDLAKGSVPSPALTPPTPEEVVRDYETVREALALSVTANYHEVPSGCWATGPRTGDAVQDLLTCPGCAAIAAAKQLLDNPGALARLRDWAARAKTLEAELARLSAAGEALHAEADGLEQRVVTAESERDAARQEIEDRAKEARELRSQVATLERERDTLQGALEGVKSVSADWRSRAEAAERRVAELEGLLNTPETDDFMRGVPLEAAHQQARWGAEHDAGKTDADWFWLLGYLGGKVLHADATPEKKRHRVIAAAAVCLNWHRHLMGEASMRPGITPPSGEQPAPHPAPAGLLEAVGPFMALATVYARTRLTDTKVVWAIGDKDGDAEITVGDCRKLAAYDAAKAGETHYFSVEAKARRWDEAVERAKNKDAMYRAACAAFIGVSKYDGAVETDINQHCVQAQMRGMGPALARFFGITLDMPPSGPGGMKPVLDALHQFKHGERHGESESGSATTSPLPPESLTAVVEHVAREAERREAEAHKAGDGLVVAEMAGKALGAREVLSRYTSEQAPKHPDTARLRSQQGLLVAAVSDITAGMAGATYQPGCEARLLAGLRALNGLSLGTAPGLSTSSSVEASDSAESMTNEQARAELEAAGMDVDAAKGRAMDLVREAREKAEAQSAPALAQSERIRIPGFTEAVLVTPALARRLLAENQAQPEPTATCGATTTLHNGESVSPCDLPLGHNEQEDWLCGKAVLHKGWCLGSRFVWSADEPAAPEVVTEKDGVRVEKHPDTEDYTVSFSHAMGAHGALGVLARALDEAKREARDAKVGHLVRAEVLKAERRKAAEDMRERVARRVSDAGHDSATREVNDLMQRLADAIRSEPLE